MPPKAKKTNKATAKGSKDWARWTVEGLKRNWFPETILRPKRKAAALDLWIEEKVKSGVYPPAKINWQKFCDDARDACDGWRDKKEGKPARAFTHKTIYRKVTACVKEQAVLARLRPYGPGMDLTGKKLYVLKRTGKQDK
jgi:hypothetical protein